MFALSGGHRTWIEKANIMAAHPAPQDGDVVVRRSSSPDTSFVLGTLSVPDQLIYHTRDEAVSQALAFARRQRVRAWFASKGDEFILLGTFGEESITPARSA